MGIRNAFMFSFIHAGPEHTLVRNNHLIKRQGFIRLPTSFHHELSAIGSSSLVVRGGGPRCRFCLIGARGLSAATSDLLPIIVGKTSLSIMAGAP